MLDVLTAPKGRLRLHCVKASEHAGQPDIWIPLGNSLNTVLYKWGFIAGKTIGHGDRDYRINTMYIEFENVTSPTDTVSVPSIARDEGTSYYEGLSSSSVRDYMRVSLIGDPTISIESGFESYFTEGVDGNLLTFFAQTAAPSIHGKTFSSVVNSKIFGAALVAAPVAADRTQDIVFSRGYFDIAQQTLKEASSQVGVTWELPFL